MPPLPLRPHEQTWRNDDVGAISTPLPSLDTTKLKRFIPFRKLDEAALLQVATQARLLSCMNGEYCLHNGQPADQVLFLLSGELLVTLPDLDDSIITSGTLAANFPLNHDASAAINARARTPSTLLAFPRELIQRIRSG